MKLLNNKSNSKKRQVNRGGGRIGPSYYAKASGSPPRSPFKKRPPFKKPPTKLFKRGRNLLIAIVVVVMIVFCLIAKPAYVTVNSTAYHSAATYQEASNKAFKALRNHSKLTLDRSGISETLKKQFPEIDSVKIGVALVSQIPKLHISIATPTFNFSSSNNIYIVGSNGVVSGLSSQLSESSKLPTVIDQSGYEATPGKQVLGTETVGFINTVLAECKRANVKVQSMTLPAAAQELELRAQNQAYFVKFYLGGDALNQVGQYLAAKHKFDTDKSGPSQYLDVRVVGKVFYQ
jgi:hypothetical protein